MHGSLCLIGAVTHATLHGEHAVFAITLAAWNALLLHAPSCACPARPPVAAWLTHLVEALLCQLCLLGLYPRLAVCWGGDATDLELEASIVVGGDANL